jgi:hypothetical protein
VGIQLTRILKVDRFLPNAIANQAPKAQLLCQRVEPPSYRYGVPRDNPFHLCSPKDITEFLFRLHESPLLFLGQIFAGAIDVKVQHRHRRLIWLRFASLAVLGRPFQPESNLV